MFETAHSHGLVCQNLHTDTSFIANMSRSVFASVKTMGNMHYQRASVTAWSRNQKGMTMLN